MADTVRTEADLLASIPAPGSQDLSNQVLRDLVTTMFDLVEETQHPMASCYIDPGEAHTALTAVVTQDVYLKVAGTTTELTAMNNLAMSGNNKLLYSGSEDFHFHVACSITMTAVGSNKKIAFRLAKNGDATTADAVATTITRTVGTGTDFGAVAIHGDFTLSTNDYIELWGANSTDATDFTVTNFYFFAMGLPTTA